ncbi:TetR/AcrR family transcriptional regulator [Microbacterium sp.]|uniref:TetR/AcrR family transcriptional regulator n=1 Tax=Microbacterium sp. TaxID=51671 RepID=UPI00260A90E6|nr:TetR/AcrR family transcriptional regulator [Microbacterium sp.]
MRSASEDLTTRARIRETAIAAFARGGFDGTSLRSIAREAGVSPALIVHHFSDKSELRRICDEYIAEVFTDENHDLIDAPTGERIQAALNDLDRYGPYIDYLGRMLTDGSSAADRLFDSILAGTRKMLDDQRTADLLEPMSDPEMTALLLALMGLGPVVMRAQIARALGQDQLSSAGMLRSTLPTMELLTHGIYKTDAFLQGTRAALGSPQAPTTAPSTDAAPPTDPATSADTPPSATDKEKP